MIRLDLVWVQSWIELGRISVLARGLPGGANLNGHDGHDGLSSRGELALFPASVPTAKLEVGFAQHSRSCILWKTKLLMYL